MTEPIRRPKMILAGMGLCARLILQGTAGECAEPQLLQGTWKINHDLTASLQDSSGQSGHRGSHGGGGMGHGHHHGGGGGYGSGDGGGNGGGEPGGSSTDRPSGGGRSGDTGHGAPDLLTIAQKPGELTVTDDTGRARVFQTDGRKVHTEDLRSGPADLAASWDQDGSLTVKVTPDKGAKRTESYVVSNDGKHLYVTVTISGGFLSSDRKLVRAYDPVTPEPAPSEPQPPPAPPS